MAYSQAFVIAGGVAHVPIIITILRFFDGKTSGRYKAKKAAADKAKAQAEAAKAQEASAAKAAAKAEADAKAKAQAIEAKPNAPEEESKS